ncbi:tetratricopeptide repeat protein [Moraxella cuniculi]|uniref:Type IV secretion system putative lipoprotein virB7 n=1 Tax=Moraxella cuniculi TaxID=34061 RepID=A0A448GXG7_9GAMM|nr:tetratricopeptide repeat protein [Moraxella cuniculi]VEG13462.1 Polar organelle development protein [Moraxella cuniculi]
MKKYLLTAFFAVFLTACQTLPARGQAEKAQFDQAVSLYQAKNYAQAKQLFEQSTHMKAKRYLGLMYLNGEGVAKDKKQAFAYFKQASEQGDITSQYWLGFCCENGIGTAQNLTQAVGWYKKSAARGDHISQPAIEALKRLNVK